MLYITSENGHLDCTKFILDIIGSDFTYIALRGACRGGHLHCVKYIVENENEKDRVYLLESVLYDACYGGSLDIVNFLIDSFNVDDFVGGLQGACDNNHVECAKLMIEHGADQAKESMYYAIHNGHIDCVRLLIQKFGIGTISTIVVNYEDLKVTPDIINLIIDHANEDVLILNKVFLFACRIGDLKMIQFIISKKIKFDINTGFKLVCQYGHSGAFYFLISKIERKFNCYLLSACYGGHLDFVKVLVDRGANRFNEALCCACKNDHVECINFLIEKGENNWNGGLVAAMGGKYHKSLSIMAIAIMINKGATVTDNLYKHFSYPEDREKLIYLIGAGVPKNILQKVPGINELYEEIDKYKTRVAGLMYDMLLNDVINIVVSYVTLN